MSTDTVKEYLDHPMTQTTVDMIVADTLPIIKEHFEREDVSPWDLDRETMVELASFIMQTTKDQGLFSSQH